MFSGFKSVCIIRRSCMTGFQGSKKLLGYRTHNDKKLTPHTILLKVNKQSGTQQMLITNLT